MKALRVVGLAACLGLASACGSLTAPPADTFYRLAPRSEAPVTGPAAPLVAVVPFSASGLHGERALIFAHGDDLVLEQYNYHFWIDSPRVLLQQRLADDLRATGVRVVDERSATANVVEGRIARFERQSNGGQDVAEVAIHIDAYVDGDRVPRLSRDYAASVTLDDASLVAYVKAANQAVENVFVRAVADLTALWGS